MTYTHEHAAKALDLALSLSATEERKQAFRDYFNKLIRNESSWKTITILLIGSIYDGLKYGNWPDVKH